MRILGIETSCDETGIAIYDDGQGDLPEGILAHQLYSQIAVHADYGGVVPELASRDHVRKTIPLIKAVLKEANLTPSRFRRCGIYGWPRISRCIISWLFNW